MTVLAARTREICATCMDTCQSVPMALMQPHCIMQLQSQIIWSVSAQGIWKPVVSPLLCPTPPVCSGMVVTATSVEESGVSLARWTLWWMWALRQRPAFCATAPHTTGEERMGIASPSTGPSPVIPTGTKMLKNSWFHLYLAPYGYGHIGLPLQ